MSMGGDMGGDVSGATSEFEAGDVVVLKSGGPQMTVKYSASENEVPGKVRCEWFDGKTKKTGDFVPATLTTPGPILLGSI